MYHLCGHVKIKTMVQCAEMVEKQVAAAKSQVTCFAHQVCDDVADTSHAFPDLCAKCQQNGVVGDVMEQQPGMKLEILRSWRPQQQRVSEGMVETGTEAQTPEGMEVKTIRGQELDDATAVSSIPETSSEASTDTIQTPTTMASSASSPENIPELGSLKTRIAALMDRTEQLLLKVRAHKASQADSKQSSRGASDQ